MRMVAARPPGCMAAHECSCSHLAQRSQQTETGEKNSRVELEVRGPQQVRKWEKEKEKTPKVWSVSDADVTEGPKGHATTNQECDQRPEFNGGGTLGRLLRPSWEDLLMPVDGITAAAGCSDAPRGSPAGRTAVPLRSCLEHTPNLKHWWFMHVAGRMRRKSEMQRAQASRREGRVYVCAQLQSTSPDHHLRKRA